MKYSVVDELKRPLENPWLVRVSGWTRDRFLAEAPETQFCEFERGDLIMHSPVRARHQEIVRFLTYLLTTHCGKSGAGRVLNGPAALQLSEDIIREPDIFVIPEERVPGMGQLPVVAVPSIIIEVVSPSTRNLDLRVKPEEYRAIGVSEYWSVDYERQELTVHWPFKVVKAGSLASGALAEFRITVDWLWQDPLPRETDCIRT